LDGQDYRHRYILLCKYPTFGNTTVNCGYRGKITMERVNGLGIQVHDQFDLTVSYGNAIAFVQTSYQYNQTSLVQLPYGGVQYLALYIYEAPGYSIAYIDAIQTNYGSWLDGNEFTALNYSTPQHSSVSYSSNPTVFKQVVCIGVSTPYGSNLLNVNGGIYATSSIAAVVAADIDMFVFQNTGATYTKAAMVASIAATGGTGSYFFYGQQSTSSVALKIFSNGNIQNTNNSYGSISDARLKENIKDATPKLDDLMKVKVRNYNLKGESNKQLGVISQELEAIFPNMIEESTNIGESMKIKGVKYSVFVPMLIKAIQEQQEQINELKQLINK